MSLADEDEQTLASLGYKQELHRGLGAFSNFALSLSIICILAGGVTSFSIGLNSVGGAAIGLGWPIACLFSLIVALTMAQVASAFPTAGGLYHWASVLGGRGWGWLTAWFNLAGLVTVLAAINVGTIEFALAAIGKPLGFDLDPGPESTEDYRKPLVVFACVVVITVLQAILNDRGIRLTARLTDFSGWLILGVAVSLTVSLLIWAPHLDIWRLVRFENFSGLPDQPSSVWPQQNNRVWLFFLGLLLPAYTITGFDASAHAAEETRQASRHVPRGIVRSVAVSGVFGWVMLCSVVIAAPDLKEAAMHGGDAFVWIVTAVLPQWLVFPILVGIVLAQFLCGLATITSASRMFYAFARDGGMPLSWLFATVNSTRRVPGNAIWATAFLAIAFTVYTPVYSTITVVCTLLLYASYVVPTMLGFLAFGKSWTTMGPWNLGAWYRPLALVAVIGCGGLFVIGVQPPNEKALTVLLGFFAVLAVFWLLGARRYFPGPRGISPVKGTSAMGIETITSGPGGANDRRSGSV